MLNLRLQQARNLHLAAQGLLKPPRARAKRASVLSAIERMSLLQIDTIHIVARSPYLVLFSRLGDYAPHWLDELLAQGSLFECWAHEACFAPMADFELHRHPSTLRLNHWAYRSAQRMHNEHTPAIERLLAHIREHGPVKASDFKPQQKGTAGWWGWKDEKRWLEAAFVLGELMIARREKFQRVYDLRERVLARAGLVATEQTLDAQAIRRSFERAAVRSLGITQARWIADYFRSGKKLKDDDLNGLVETGELVRVEVSDWARPGYVHRDNEWLLDRARKGQLRASHTALLSPFDPVVWDRERASALFGFDYTIECYTPAPKRRYGYYVLPILHCGRLIGRLDAKAWRDEGVFEIKAIYLEPGVDAEAVAEDVANAIQRTADWHQTPRVTVRKSEPKPFTRCLRDALKRIISSN